MKKQPNHLHIEEKKRYFALAKNFNLITSIYEIPEKGKKEVKIMGKRNYNEPQVDVLSLSESCVILTSANDFNGEDQDWELGGGAV